MVRRSRAVVSAVVLSGALCVAAVGLGAQDRASGAGERDPVFDVVSIKRNNGDIRAGSSIRWRPDGGLTMINVPAGAIVARAYTALAPGPPEGLPRWALSELYDVVATSTLTAATPAQREAMLRAMLADRFQLKGRVEPRTEDGYHAVLARADGRLGPGLTKIDTDCEAVAAERREAAARGERTPFPAREGAMAPCLLRSVAPNPRDGSAVGNVLEGEGTMAAIISLLRVATGAAPVADKTGLTGSFRVRMVYDQFALQRRPEDPAPFDAPNVLTAVTEQLGLKLQRAKVERTVLVVERMERPSEN